MNTNKARKLIITDNIQIRIHPLDPSHPCSSLSHSHFIRTRNYKFLINQFALAICNYK